MLGTLLSTSSVGSHGPNSFLRGQGDSKMLFEHPPTSPPQLERGCNQSRLHRNHSLVIEPPTPPTTSIDNAYGALCTPRYSAYHTPQLSVARDRETITDLRNNSCNRPPVTTTSHQGPETHEILRLIAPYVAKMKKPSCPQLENILGADQCDAYGVYAHFPSLHTA